MTLPRVPCVSLLAPLPLPYSSAPHVLPLAPTHSTFPCSFTHALPSSPPHTHTSPFSPSVCASFRPFFLTPDLLFTLCFVHNSSLLTYHLRTCFLPDTSSLHPPQIFFHRPDILLILRSLHVLCSVITTLSLPPHSCLCSLPDTIPMLSRQTTVYYLTIICSFLSSSPLLQLNLA